MQGVGGTTFVARFKFNPPTTNIKIDEFYDFMKLSLPTDYKDFLLMHDGVHLFNTPLGGAIEFFSLKEIRDNYNFFLSLYKDEEEKYRSCIPIGSFPDVGYIVMDLDIYRKDEENYIWINGITPRPIKGKFTWFFDRLIVSQGSPYWEWI